jgi:hypothetical protein
LVFGASGATSQGVVASGASAGGVGGGIAGRGGGRSGIADGVEGTRVPASQPRSSRKCPFFLRSVTAN